ncbi:hypothetical protein MHBO_000231 [Bonamia ostreae]|uniref:Uncharacterized protein n=1 Tax=Bonamia ostreae TaxID=126728 RepID=A0ABV2AEV1_9EUKA
MGNLSASKVREALVFPVSHCLVTTTSLKSSQSQSFKTSNFFYRLDPIQFLTAVKFRIMKIQLELDQKVTENTFFCGNKDCEEKDAKIDVMQLLSGKINKKGEFVCESCDQVLVSSAKTSESSNRDLLKKFNLQIEPVL